MEIVMTSMETRLDSGVDERLLSRQPKNVLYLSKKQNGGFIVKYYVIEGRNIGTIRNPEMIETVMFVTEDKMEAARYEDSLRKTYKDRTTVDCWVRSDEEIEKAKRAKDLYDSLTEEQKHEYITVDGRKYVKAIYEANNK